jgi:hypothetical protein
MAASSDPLDNWHWRNPLPTGNSLAAVAYGGSGFVAVASSRGNGPVIASSTDGTNWVGNAFGLSDSLYAVTYGNGLYLAVGFDDDAGNAAFLISGDARNWAAITPQADAASFFFGAAFGNGKFVAVGEAGKVLTSPDALTWTAHTTGTGNDLAAVAFGNGVFAAVDGVGEILTSTNGASWQVRYSNTAQSFTAISYGNGKFVAVGGNGAIFTSADATSWSAQTSGTSAYLSGISGGNSRFVAVGYNVILTSTDATNWTMQASDAALAAAACGDTTFVTVGSSANNTAAILTSPNGTTWAQRVSGTTTKLGGITYDNALFVAVGDGGTLLTSPDGWTWTGRTSGTSANLFGVAHSANGLLVAVGDSGTVVTSSDGVHWASQSSGSSVSLKSLVYGQGLFVALSPAASSTILTSADGTNWTVRLSNTGNNDYLNGVASGNGRFVAAGGGTYSIIARSYTGLSWTEVIGPWSTRLGSIAFGNGVFVAPVGDGVLTTTDGTNWFHQTLGYNPGLVTYDLCFAAVATGAVGLSTNGTNWTSHSTGFQNAAGALGYGGGRMVIVGDAGSICTSDPINPMLGVGPLPQLTLTGVVGLRYEIQVSTNLVDWAVLTNFTLSANPRGFSDPATGAGRRFFRARIL